MALELKCVHKFRKSSNAIYGYRLMDKSGKFYECTPEELKKAIKNNRVKVVNLKLTSDNKLIDAKSEQPIEKTENRAIMNKRSTSIILRKEGKEMIEIGKRYSWKEITKEYPDMYAIITDIEKERGIIQSCKVLEIVPFEQEEETVCKYKKLGVKFNCVRTTFSAPTMGVFF